MAGKAVVNQIQLGDSSTATHNFVWQTNADGSCKLARGNAGATTQDILTVDAAGKVLLTQGQLTQSAAVNTTSGTYQDFLSIPSWVKRITLNFDGVSTNGTSNLLVQLGDSGGVENTGYKASGIYGTTVTGSTSGFTVTAFRDSSAETYSGSIVLSLLDSSTFKWVESGILATEGARTHMSAGSKATSAVLDRIRLTTVNGTDVFDGGAVSILYGG